MNKAQKIKAVEELNGQLKKSNSVLIVYYHGLTVSDITDLRKEMSVAGAKLKIVKNAGKNCFKRYRLWFFI